MATHALTQYDAGLRRRLGADSDYYRRAWQESDDFDPSQSYRAADMWGPIEGSETDTIIAAMEQFARRAMAPGESSDDAGARLATLQSGLGSLSNPESEFSFFGDIDYSDLGDEFDYAYNNAGGLPRASGQLIRIGHNVDPSSYDPSIHAPNQPMMAQIDGQAIPAEIQIGVDAAGRPIFFNLYEAAKYRANIYGQDDQGRAYQSANLPGVQAYGFMQEDGSVRDVTEYLLDVEQGQTSQPLSALPATGYQTAFGEALNNLKAHSNKNEIRELLNMHSQMLDKKLQIMQKEYKRIINEVAPVAGQRGSPASYRESPPIADTFRQRTGFSRGSAEHDQYVQDYMRISAPGMRETPGMRPPATQAAFERLARYQSGGGGYGTSAGFQPRRFDTGAPIDSSEMMNTPGLRYTPNSSALQTAAVQGTEITDSTTPTAPTMAPVNTKRPSVTDPNVGTADQTGLRLVGPSSVASRPGDFITRQASGQRRSIPAAYASMGYDWNPNAPADSRGSGDPRQGTGFGTQVATAFLNPGAAISGQRRRAVSDREDAAARQAGRTAAGTGVETAKDAEGRPGFFSGERGEFDQAFDRQRLIDQSNTPEAVTRRRNAAQQRPIDTLKKTTFDPRTWARPVQALGQYMRQPTNPETGQRRPGLLNVSGREEWNQSMGYDDIRSPGFLGIGGKEKYTAPTTAVGRFADSVGLRRSEDSPYWDRERLSRGDAEQRVRTRSQQRNQAGIGRPRSGSPAAEPESFNPAGAARPATGADIATQRTSALQESQIKRFKKLSKIK